MSEASKPARSTRLEGVLNDAVLERASPRRQQSEKTEEFPDIASNPFYGILLAGEANPNQRKAEFRKVMNSTLERDADRTRIREFETFREWLAAKQTELAQQIISLTNTEVTAELQAVIDELITALNDYDGEIGPLMDMVDSIYQLRTSGVVVDAFREIKEDREFEENAKKTIGEKDGEIELERIKVRKLKDDILELGEERSLFGFGGVKESSRIEIARKEAAIKEAEAKVLALETDRNGLNGQLNDRRSKLGEMVEHKNRLRELLDLTSTEHKERVSRLVTNANGFIDKSKSRIGSLRNQFTGLSDQLDAAEDNCSAMTKVYAVMNEGLKEASADNTKLRSTLVLTPEAEATEDTISKVEREENLRTLDTFVKMLHGSTVDTMSTYGDLTQQAIRVNTMKEATQAQIDTTRKLHSQGISATADRLAVVLTAVSGAALGEASGVAKDVLQQMRDSTNQVAGREVIRVAMGIAESNTDLDHLMQELQDMSEITRKATDIRKIAVSDINERMDMLREQAATLHQDFKNAVAVHSEANEDDDGKGKAGAATVGGKKNLLGV